MEVEGLGKMERESGGHAGREAGAGHGLREPEWKKQGSEVGSRKGDAEPNGNGGAGSCRVGGFLTA